MHAKNERNPPCPFGDMTTKWFQPITALLTSEVRPGQRVQSRDQTGDVINSQVTWLIQGSELLVLWSFSQRYDVSCLTSLVTSSIWVAVQQVTVWQRVSRPREQHLDNKCIFSEAPLIRIWTEWTKSWNENWNENIGSRSICSKLHLIYGKVK